MSTEALPLRRAVLKLGTSDVDRRQFRAVAEFSRLLRLEMLGVFVEDPMLIGLALLPFARELRLPGFGWQAMQPKGVVADLRASAQRFRQLFERAAEAQGVPARFEVRAESPAALAGELSGPADVVIVVEPGAMGVLASEREQQRRAVSRRGESVLLLPRSGMPELGPVAAVAAEESDPCFALASRVAVATGEEPVVIAPGAKTSLLASLSRTLGARRERLLIVPAEGIPRDQLIETSSRRCTPVLVVGSS